VPDLISVTFVKQHGPYNAGEVATFPAAQAKVLFHAKSAVPTQSAAVPDAVEDGPALAKASRAGRGVAAKKGGYGA
jgi:hypothetical protein